MDEMGRRHAGIFNGHAAPAPTEHSHLCVWDRRVYRGNGRTILTQSAHNGCGVLLTFGINDAAVRASIAATPGPPRANPTYVSEEHDTFLDEPIEAALAELGD